jgi:hypothetical protein
MTITNRFFITLSIAIITHHLQSMEKSAWHVSPNEHSLLKASLGGNTAEVKYFLDKDTNINIEDALGRTPLYCATIMGTTPTIELLLTRGASIPCSYASSPLYSAIHFGHLEIADLLISYGCINNVDTKESEKNERLKRFTHIATDHPYMIEFMLSQDISIHSTSIKKIENLIHTANLQDYASLLTATPTKELLKHAIKNGYFGLTRLLMKKGIIPALEDLTLAKTTYLEEKDKDTLQKMKALQVIGRQLINRLRLAHPVGCKSYPPISKSGIMQVFEKFNVPLDITKFIAYRTN